MYFVNVKMQYSNNPIIVIVFVLVTFCNPAFADKGSEAISANTGFHVTNLFQNVTYANTNLFSIIPARGYGIGDQIIITGQTLSDEGIPLSGVTISGTLQDIPEQIVNKTLSDENGNFEIGIQTPKNLPAETEVTPTLSAQYNGTTYSWTGDLILDDIKKFTLFEDGKSSTVLVRQQNVTADSLSLDKDQKKLTILLTDTESSSSFMVLIPSEVLSGDMIVEAGKNPALILPSDQDWKDISGDDYWLNVKKYDGFTLIAYQQNNAETDKLDVTGTTAIPEFPFTAQVLLIGIASLIVLHRMNFRL